MRETIQNALPTITIAMLGLALLLFLLSLRLFRRSRTDVYWRRRREAGQRGWRIFVLAFTLTILGSVSCILTLLVGVWEEDNPAPTSTQVITVQDRTTSPAPTVDGTSNAPTPDNATTVEQIPTPTPSTPVFVVITATPDYTPTATPFPTFTLHFTPIMSSVTPQPGAKLRITALDDQITDTLRPISPRTSFDAGTKRIYLFVEYSDMSEGVLWRRELYKDGVQLSAHSYLWGLERDGEGYFFFGQDTGFEPGNYEIRLYIGETTTPASVMPFTIIPTP